MQNQGFKQESSSSGESSSEDDELKQALKMSEQQAKFDSQTRDNKYGQAQPVQMGFQDMALDTAGFQKFMEMTQ